MISLAVYWLDPISAVSHTDPKMGVSWVSPVSSITFEIPAMEALLDVRGLHSFVGERISFEEAYSTELTKALIENLTLDDSSAFSLELPKQETVSISESFARICDFQRVFNENLSLADSARLELSKRFSENLSISDTTALVYTKPITEGISFQESLFKKSMTRGVGEVVGVSDATALSLSVLYTEPLNISDLVLLSQSKPFTENVLFQESLFSKTVSKLLSDGFSVSDTFTLSTNDYCNISYFAEDYVGVTRIV